MGILEQGTGCGVILKGGWGVPARIPGKGTAGGGNGSREGLEEQHEVLGARAGVGR